MELDIADWSFAWNGIYIDEAQVHISEFVIPLSGK